ncbi:MAG TPA: dihydroorotate dehydrogenase [bacterium]|nr:dihydroorotate dehydrogenase [bacterium]HNS48096.1 dihydroorotate dehydrogenase [bacterium]
MSKTPDLALRFAGIKLRNPLVLLSGTAGAGREIKKLVELGRFGALCTKTVTFQPRPGNPPPRIAETPSGLVNSIGLENPGFARFLEETAPGLRSLPLPVIASIAGNGPELSRMAEALTGAGPAGLEINLSCPNVGGAFNPTAPTEIERLLREVRRATGLPLLAKLPPDFYRIGDLARAAETAGCDGLTVANTLPAMVFDLKLRKPRLGGITGGLSGPAVLPVSLYLVHRARQAVGLPIIGSGGVHDADGAVSMLLAGAQAIGLGTVNFFRPLAYREILQALAEFRTAGPGRRKPTP